MINSPKRNNTSETSFVNIDRGRGGFYAEPLYIPIGFEPSNDVFYSLEDK